MVRRIGIYSGTFDPIHAGHIAFGNAALRTCGLDMVVFVPEADPRGKTNVTELRHRAAMIRRAVRPHEGLDSLTLESSRFTIDDTMPELRRLFPGAELSLLIGSDVARTLSKWGGLEQLQDVGFIVGMRQHDDQEEIEAALRRAALRCRLRFELVTTASPHVNSSTIRNGDMSQLPAEITPYVQTNNLYN